MTFNTSIMTILEDSNPVPDPEALVGSSAAAELAMRRPESIIDWHHEGEGYAGDGYRIQLLEPGTWQVTSRRKDLGGHRSLKLAFAVAERHRRAALRRRSLVIWGALTLMLLTATAVAASYSEEWGSTVGFVALLAFLSVLSGFVSRIVGRPGDRLRDNYQ